MWCVPELDEQYIQRMEDILAIYEKPLQEREPVVCVDEKPVVLHRDVRPPLAMKPSKPLRCDCEYERGGTANVFCGVQPKAGRYFLKVTSNRCSPEFADYLLDIAACYLEADTIHLILDNLSSHTRKAVVERFGEQDGSWLWDRFTVHYTPAHGSWLNQAEIAIGLFSRQCLGRLADRTPRFPPNSHSRLDSSHELASRSDPMGLYAQESTTYIWLLNHAVTVLADKSNEQSLPFCNRANFQAIFQGVETGILIIDPATHRIVDANPVALKLIGAPLHETVGAVCHRFVCPAETGQCPVTDLGKTVDNSERVLLTASAERRSIIKTVRPVELDGHGYLLESFFDITERQRSEKALEQRTSYLNTLIETNPLGTVVFTKNNASKCRIPPLSDCFFFRMRKSRVKASTN